MAKFVLTAGYVTLTGSTITDHVQSIEVTVDKDLPDATAMGDTWSEFLSGVKSWSMTVNYFQDFASGNVDALNWAIANGTTSPTIQVKATTAAQATANPLYSGTVHVASYSPVSNAHGEAAQTSVTYTGTGALTRSS